MSLLHIAQEFGLELKKTSPSGGGEYHSSCPKCGGDDRFMIWEGKGTYWCRQCDIKGGTIRFCCDFLGLSYVDACKKIGVSPQRSHNWIPARPIFAPKVANVPSEIWQQQAARFVQEAHRHVVQDIQALRTLEERGLISSTITTYSLGWNPVNRWDPLELWGLNDPVKRRIYLPKGIVIPTFRDDMLIKLKIRRSEWHPHDRLPKYLEISGSMQTPQILGRDLTKPLFILESELDAMLMQQEAGDLCSCMAIGGAGKKPDASAHKLLTSGIPLLFCLDFDEAGKKAYRFWKETYPSVHPWPTPEGKSPGSAFQLGLNVRAWVECGINQIINSKGRT